MSNSIVTAVRSKYPQYADISDEDLTLKIGDRFPVYLDAPDFAQDFNRLKNTGSTKSLGEFIAEAPAPTTDLMAIGSGGRIPEAETTPGGPIRTLYESAVEPAVDLSKHLGLTPQIISDAFSAMDAYAARASGEVSNEETQAILAEPSQPPGPVAKVASGAQNAVIDALEFMTSPVGVATLGLGAAPAGVQRAAAGMFVADMARHTPQQVMELSKAIESKDPEAISRTATGLGLAGAFIYAGGKAVLRRDVLADAADQPPKATIEQVAAVAEVSNLPATAEALRGTERMPKQEGTPISLPPVPEGHVRFYHGGVPGEGARDVSHSYIYAKGYADKSTKGVVQYVEIPKDSPLLTKAFDDTGLPYEAPYNMFTAPAEVMANAKVIESGAAQQKSVPIPDFTTAVGITPSPATAAMVRPLAEPSFWRKWFTAAGNLPKPVHDAWLKSRGEIAAEGKQIEFAVRDLYQVLQKEHGIGTIDKLKRGMQDVPKEKVLLMDEALKGDMAAMGDLSPEVRTAITTMRGHVDRLSKTLIDRGLIDEQLAVRVDENLGAYLTRSYRIFDDPKWVENIPGEVRENFVKLLESDLGNRPAAETKAREMLQDWSESGVTKEFQRGKLGRKDLTQFMKRKDLAPEVRAVLGEYKDPVLNYARSVTKVARFIGDQQFLSEVRSKGMGEFLFEEGQTKPGFEAQLAAEESAVMSPLNGLRTSPPIKEAFEGWQRSRPSDNLFFRGYFALNAISKGSKTIGSLLTQMRNLSGQPSFNLMSGHWNFKEYGKAMKAVAADIGISNDVKWREYYTKLRRLNLVDESAPAGELRDIMRDAGLRDQDFTGFTGDGWARAIRKVGIEAPIKAYRISDELGKIVGFENEKVFQKKLNPEATPEQVELLAAERIRNTYPTYSMIPEAVKQFRKQPLFGPFTSFAYEALRTSYHAIKYAAQDAKKDPAIGAQRVGGIMTVLASGAILSAIGRYIWGITKEELEDIRRFLPPWARNAQLIPIGKSDSGEISYVNWSYTNPYSYLIDPFVAAMSGKDADETEFNQRFVDAAGEFIRPFANEQMLGAAIMDIKRNQTAQGREIYNPQDTDADKVQKILGRLFEAVEPGSLTRLRKRILPAMTDTQPDFGRKLEPSIEVISEVSGVRAEKFNFGQGFQFKARRFRQDEQNAEYIFSKTIQRTGSVPDAEVSEAFRTSEQQRFQLWRDLYGDAQAAMRNGVERKQILNDLEGAGLSIADRNTLLRGEYRPKMLSTQLRQKARDAKRQLPQDEIRKIQDEFRDKPLQ